MYDLRYITSGDFSTAFNASLLSGLDAACPSMATWDKLTLKPCCIWMTGLSGAGKTTLAKALRDRLNADGVVRVVVLDCDELQAGMCKDLGSGAADRMETSRRMAAVARLLVSHGLVVVVSTMAPFRAARANARAGFEPGTFFEVHVATPLKTCMARDVKGLYRKARVGAIPTDLDLVEMSLSQAPRG